MKTFFREILLTLILAIIIFSLLQVTVQSFIVVGSSMDPNLQEGERLLINKVVYNLHEPERGDVIVFRPPNNQHGDYIKRIIALTGETVEIKQGVVYINGHQLNEPYISNLPKYSLSKQKIPANEFFVLGDNRNNSNDSHNGWTVPRENITGKAWLAIWPPTEWGVITNYSSPEQVASAMNN